FERKQHVISRKRATVVELDALAQMKPPFQRIDDLPLLGETRDDLEVLVALGQRFHDVAERTEGERLVQRIGVEGVEIALERILERGGARRGREGQPSREQARQSQTF